jgi:hypothetical protein
MNFLNKILASVGINIVPKAGDIASPVDGDIWYNSTTGKFRKQQNGSVSDLDTTGSGGGITYNEVTGTTVALAVNTGYILNNASLVTATLPASSAVGDVILIRGKGAGGWRISQNASQIIHFLDVPTLAGTGGFASSSNKRDCVDLICVVANLEWQINDAVGNIILNIS